MLPLCGMKRSLIGLVVVAAIGCKSKDSDITGTWEGQCSKEMLSGQEEPSTAKCSVTVASKGDGLSIHVVVDEGDLDCTGEAELKDGVAVVPVAYDCPSIWGGTQRSITQYSVRLDAGSLKLLGSFGGGGTTYRVEGALVAAKAATAAPISAKPISPSAPPPAAPPPPTP